eukprot:6481976-Amphidinium_carterae.1
MEQSVTFMESKTFGIRTKCPKMSWPSENICKSSLTVYVAVMMQSIHVHNCSHVLAIACVEKPRSKEEHQALKHKSSYVMC